MTQPAARHDANSADIVVQHLSKIYSEPNGTGQLTALHDLSLVIRDKEFVALLGPSGCGKSTLLNILAGFEQPTDGRVLMNGVPIAGPGPDRGVVFQDYALFPWLTVRRNVEFGLRNQGMPSKERTERADALIKLVRLEGFADHFPMALSGGMKQRVAIARVLANNPKTLLMDEPFGALDALTRLKLQKQLLEIWQVHQKTVVFITHSVEEALYLADRIVLLSARPARILEIFDVKEPRPRDLTSRDLLQMRRAALALLEAEVELT